MKTLILVGVSLAILAVAASAQVFKAERLVLSARTVISANDLQADRNASTLLARGGVRIQVDSSIITADEADIHYVKNGETTVELRGNVRLRVTRPGNEGYRG